MKLYTVTVLLVLTNVLGVLCKAKKYNYCNTCSDDRENTTSPIKIEVLNTLFEVQDEIDQQLATLTAIAGRGAPPKCDKKFQLKPHKGMKIPRRAMKNNHTAYTSLVYQNITAIDLMIQDIETFAMVTFDKEKLECAISFSAIKTGINKLLCTMKKANKKVKCRRKGKPSKVSNTQKADFVMCGLQNSGQMLQEMINLLNTCTADEDDSIACSNLPVRKLPPVKTSKEEKAKKTRKGKRRNRKKKNRKGRKNNRKGKGRQRKRNKNPSKQRKRRRVRKATS